MTSLSTTSKQRDVFSRLKFFVEPSLPIIIKTMITQNGGFISNSEKRCDYLVVGSCNPYASNDQTWYLTLLLFHYSVSVCWLKDCVFYNRIEPRRRENASLVKPFLFKEDIAMMKAVVMTQEGSDIDWNTLAGESTDRTAGSFEFRFLNMSVYHKNLFYATIFNVDSEWTLLALNKWIESSGEGCNTLTTWEKLTSKVSCKNCVHSYSFVLILLFNGRTFMRNVA
jgi:hypothetical protein